MINQTQIPYRNIPVLPLRNALLFPGQMIPVSVGRHSSLSAVDAALASDRWILVLAQKNESEQTKQEDLYWTGTLARIEKPVNPSETHHLILSGQVRFKAGEISEKDGYLVADGAPLDDLMDLDGELSELLMKNMKSLSQEISAHLSLPVEQVSAFLKRIHDPVQLTHMVSQHLDLKMIEKQNILEMLSLKNRYLKLLDLMVKLRDELKLKKEVQQKVSSKLGKQQREVLLREQIQALQEELGEGKDDLSKDYLEKIESKGMPEEVKKVALEQLSRLQALSSASPELQIIRNYLDLLVALPWSEQGGSDIDLERARFILKRDHYGLENIKKRILQHLAVMKLRKDKKGSILLLVGPPGVGKTSLAKSIAEALGREYVRISLGGVRDDAEIRGHRRTYVGALPGRIIDGIKRAGQNDPVFVLDEIDKLNRGWGGDPASAMLEVLDPEQNTGFTDHYLDVPFDLSNVFFVATANSLEGIPAPLLDRMEVIQVSGYTTEEKIHIAQKHLWPKQLKEHGLAESQITIAKEIMHELVSGYTREAGVRSLQREIASMIRFKAEKIVSSENLELELAIESSDLEEALGPEKYLHEMAEQKAYPGVVTGLAWTPVGGDILFVESRAMPGRGQLLITGQLGDVMKESAQIAFSHIRSRIQPMYPDFKLDQSDFHVHVPAGSIPKDGPSAGVTMLVSMASLALGIAVPSDLAMTGEITLRGAVMPVGGIKEKVIAAHRAGIHKVLLPKRNERDLKDVPESVKEDLQFSFVETVEELFDIALGFQLPDSDFRKLVG